MAALSSRLSKSYMIYDRIAPIGREILDAEASRSIAANAELRKRVEEVVDICNPRGFFLFSRAPEPDLSKTRVSAIRLGVQLFEEAESKTALGALAVDIPDPSVLSALIKVSLIPLIRGRSKEELKVDVQHVCMLRSLIQVLVGKYARRVLNEIPAPLITKALINRSLRALHRYLKDIVPLTEEELSGDLTEAFFKEIVHSGFQKKIASYEIHVSTEKDVGCFVDLLSTQVLQNIIYFESADISSSIERACALYSVEIPEATRVLAAINNEYLDRVVAVAEGIITAFNDMPFFIENEMELRAQATSDLASLRTLRRQERLSDGYFDQIDRALNFSYLPEGFQTAMLRIMPEVRALRERYNIAKERLNSLTAELTTLAGASFDPDRCVARDVGRKIIDCHIDMPCAIAEMWPAADLVRERASEEFSANRRFISELRKIAVMAYPSSQCSVSASGAGASIYAVDAFSSEAMAEDSETGIVRLTSAWHGFSAREAFKALLL